MKVTRWAIRINLPDTARQHYQADWIWHCPEQPKDPTNFGFAFLYHSREAALLAIKTGRSYVREGHPVEIECKVPDLEDQVSSS